MSDLNVYACTGRFTRDAEIRYLANDKVVAKFALAVSRTYTTAGEKREDVLFLDAEAWGKTAEVIGQYCQKGKQVAVNGRLRLETWEGKDGKKASKVSLVVDQLTMIGAPRAADGGAAPAAQSRPAREAEADVGTMADPPF